MPILLRSIRFMAPAIRLAMPEIAAPISRSSGWRRRDWTRRTSLTARILAVNIIALGLMAGSLFYLDSYRNQLFEERYQLARAEAQIAAQGLAATPRDNRAALMVRIGREQTMRLRLYDARGALQLDSFKLAPPTYALVDPASEPWYQHAARWLDAGMNFLIGNAAGPVYADPRFDRRAAWPEIETAARQQSTVVERRAAPDETPVINAATPVGTSGDMLLTTRNARDVTQSVRDARQTLAIVLAVTLIISIQLSLFLARTIVQPLRELVRAAIRVRLGRERQVVVPRLPDRRDEIGLLARAISDMSSALRHRIDAGESFAADVAHEIKNPLASLRSALESLSKVEDEALRRQLTEIAAHDLRRIDRLVTEIAEAGRIDAELSRTRFLPVDLLALAKSQVAARAERGSDPSCRITVSKSGNGPWEVPGDDARLERVLENLLDNAVSFSPPRGTVAVRLERQGDLLELSVSDDGPGIPAEAREKVFERFHSLRPQSEDFGSHSGLGLAIARTIAEAHDGSLTAQDRRDGKPGACLVLHLPLPEVADAE
jgi:two-component system sensor histidine kinase ChvG